MTESDLSRKLADIARIREQSPETTHIYLRRKDQALVDIPFEQAEQTLRRHPDWSVEGGSYPELPIVKAADAPDDELVILPPKPSEVVVPKTKTARTKKTA